MTSGSEKEMDMALRVLFVEHDDEVRSDYHRYFQRQGYDTFGAESAEQCIELVQRVQPDVVMLEPEFFDEDAMTRVARCLNKYSMPVVFVSRMRKAPHIETAIPAQAFFFKPVSMRLLGATLHDVAISSEAAVHHVEQQFVNVVA